MHTEPDRAPSSSWRDPASFVLLSLIVAAALFAQALVLNVATEQYGWVVFAWAAVLMTAFAPRTPAASAAPSPGAAPESLRLGWLGIAILAALAVTVLNQMRALPFLGLGLWLFALVCASVAVRGRKVTPGGGERSAFSGGEIAALSAIVALAAIARFSWINDLPPYYFSDEPRVASFLLNRLRPGSEPIELFQMGWNTWSGLGLWTQGFLLPILGSHIVGLRLSSALMGTLAVLTTYLLTRELLGRRVALLAGILLAIGRTGIDFSRLGVCHAQVMFIGSFAFWCWWRGVNTGSALSYLWAGIGLGLGLYTYNAGQLLPVLWGGWVALCVLAAPGSVQTHWRGAALTLLGFLLATFVWLVYVTDHFTFARTWYEWTYMARNRQVLGRILGVWQADGFGAALTPLWDQVYKTWLGFGVMPDSSYGIGYRAGGMLDRVTSPLFVLGLAIAAASWHGRKFFLFYWWLPTTILGGVLTESPPTSWRLVGIVPLLAIIAALPLDAILEAGRRQRSLHAMAVILVIAVLGAAGWDNWRSYFVDFGNSDAMVDLSSSLSHQIEKTSADTQVILVGPEETFNLHSELFDVNFDARRLHDVADAATLLPIRIVAAAPVLLVFAPHAARLADQVRTFYPEVEIRDVNRRDGDDLMYRLAHISAEQLLSRSGLSVVSPIGTRVVGDPFSPLPTDLAGADLQWSGRVFWPTDQPVQVQLSGGATGTLHLGEDFAVNLSGPQPILATVHMPRGWQSFRLDEPSTGVAARPALILHLNEEEHPLSRQDLRPDMGSNGVRARYERDGSVILDSREPQIHLCTREQVFRKEELAVTLPYVVSWQTILQVDDSGGYEFEVRSTAPFAINLDDSALCRADTMANVGAVSCFISRDLDAGPHPIVAWWDGSDASRLAQNILQISWRRSGAEAFQLVPAENLTIEGGGSPPL